MDNLNLTDIELPPCAMYRHVGTVCVKSSDTDSCGRTRLTDSCDDSDEMSEKCELCCRNRINSKSSDCDSEGVKKCRPYRSSVARSRYVNVCAAVCLLLLVGGLSPSSAAPHGRNILERHRRTMGENNLWGNPCDYADGGVKSSKPYTSEDAERVANQARNALSAAEKFKDVVSKNLHSFDKFDEMLAEFENTHWLRSDKYKSFMADTTLPKEKTRIDQVMPPEYLKAVVSNIDQTLPSLHKALKMVIAGLYAVTQKGLDGSLVAEVALKENFEATMHRVRGVLCNLNEIMSSRHIDTIPLEDSEVPDVTANDRLTTVFVIYRDTMLFLDYLAQVMDVLAKEG